MRVCFSIVTPAAVLYLDAVLSAKPWKPDAIARLFVSVLLSFFGGSLVVTTVFYSGPGGVRAAEVYLAGAGAVGFLIAALALLQRQWLFEKFLRDLLLWLFCFSASAVLGLWLQEKAGAPPRASTGLLMLVVEPAVLLLLWRFVREHQVRWVDAFGYANARGPAVLYGLLAACLFLPVGWGLQYLSASAMLRLHVEPQEQEVVQTLQASGALFNQVSLGVVAVVLAPVAEESFFRGILYPALKQAGFPRFALWATALLFAFMHFNVVSFVPLLLLALVLTLLYEGTNNLLAPIAAHALFNLVNFAYLCLREAAGPK